MHEFSPSRCTSFHRGLSRCRSDRNPAVVLSVADDRHPARDGLLAEFIRVLGPNHPATLLAPNDLACRRAVAEAAAGAVAALAGLSTALLRVLGPAHPRTLTARVNLARWPLGTGDAAATALEEL